tara:strand:- start:17883 stop:18728 length:846 start_codon:yes stop_codon:yes gene_type:complete
MATHEFGGGWTEIKLDLLQRYLEAWLRVMKNQPFELVYVDAFAGSGKCSVRGQDGEIDGSALRALSLHGFGQYYFFEQDRGRAQDLRNICQDPQFSGKNIDVQEGDGNALVKKMLNEHDWQSTRAVLFLDPYGMEVEWETLKAIAETEAIDVWYLFSISGLFRNAALQYSAVDKGKEAILTRTLGTDEWKLALYEQHPQGGLFDTEPNLQRAMEVADLEIYVKDRLSTVFPKVLNPKRLVNNKNAPLFSLFFAVSNPGEKAQGIAAGIANHLLHKLKTPQQ